MKNLSITQEYYLCAVNAKGKIPMMKFTAVHAAMFAGGILELLENGFIKRDDDKKVITAKPPTDDFCYLKPIYDYIAAEKPMKLKSQLVSLSNYVNSSRQFDELFPAIGISLVKVGCADEITSQGLLNSKERYAPKPEAVDAVIKKIRAELLDDGTLTDETLCLTVLLEKSFIITDYFSKAESEKLKKRIDEVRTSDAYAVVKEIFDVALAGGMDLWH
jgi:hypothetical protein